MRIKQFYPILFFFLIASSSMCFAQKKFEFTYITDMRFHVIHELDGQVFVPAAYQKALEDPRRLKAGKILVNMYKNKVSISGIKEITSDFYIINKSRNKKLGFVYELMDARNQPAKMKIILDKENYVELIYFFSKTAGEHTFYLAEKSAKEMAEEKSFYTAKDQFFVRSYSNLVEKTINPYFVIKDFPNSMKKEILDQDENVFFEFQESQIVTKWGTYTIKNKKTADYTHPKDATVKSIIQVDLKGKGKVRKMYIYLNYKKEVAFIEVGTQRFYLMP